ncbi:MAG: phenylacetate-CoA oxygenase subunit PaaI [Bacteroidetes bacterium MED-G17]|nr:MAG: phenylacetate-CoA oxygenase subunit PaaI [Bacteroidetes bacterium TMED39]PDH52579.1 MAG: phenylacetate-CoA oxygenase subunit PaaI [Bacteroidetes bacterium MED-G17]|tara:strand:+ start:1058 stop:1810 length:753 start_codon:yes stop_codon:yes gene_type:complete
MSEYIKELLYKMADDQLIIGHRNSEWTGLGPLLEEDIAFSSMAQDKVGQSQHLYQLLHELGASDPDTVAFTRNAKQFHCCQLVELPIGDYSFSIVRHFLFDFAEALRFEALSNSSFQPLAQVARKFKGEIKYHTLHANTWMQQLGNGNEESKAKMQSALNEAWPYALGIFEKGHFENQLIENKVFFGEEALKQQWLDLVSPLIKKAGLKVPHGTKNTKGIGGRVGIHTEYLQPLLNEMTEVYAIDPSADW